MSVLSLVRTVCARLWWKVWTQPLIWDGFLRCARMMAKESGATSFIAMVQLPDKKLKEALASPLMKVCRDLRFQGHVRMIPKTNGVSWMALIPPALRCSKVIVSVASFANAWRVCIFDTDM